MMIYESTPIDKIKPNTEVFFNHQDKVSNFISKAWNLQSLHNNLIA